MKENALSILKYFDHFGRYVWRIWLKGKF